MAPAPSTPRTRRPVPQGVLSPAEKRELDDACARLDRQELRAQCARYGVATSAKDATPRIRARLARFKDAATVSGIDSVEEEEAKEMPDAEEEAQSCLQRRREVRPLPEEEKQEVAVEAVPAAAAVVPERAAASGAGPAGLAGVAVGGGDAPEEVAAPPRGWRLIVRNYLRQAVVGRRGALRGGYRYVLVSAAVAAVAAMLMLTPLFLASSRSRADGARGRSQPPDVRSRSTVLDTDRIAKRLAAAIGATRHGDDAMEEVGAWLSSWQRRGDRHRHASAILVASDREPLLDAVAAVARTLGGDVLVTEKAPPDAVARHIKDAANRERHLLVLDRLDDAGAVSPLYAEPWIDPYLDQPLAPALDVSVDRVAFLWLLFDPLVCDETYKYPVVANNNPPNAAKAAFRRFFAADLPQAFYNRIQHAALLCVVDGGDGSSSSSSVVLKDEDSSSSSSVVLEDEDSAPS